MKIEKIKKLTENGDFRQKKKHINIVNIYIRRRIKIMEHLLSSDNLLQAVLTLVGVFFSCFFSTGKATRNMKKELKKHEVYLQEKFYYFI